MLITQLFLILNLMPRFICRFDNQVTNEKLVQKYFCVVKFARYIV